MGRPKWRLIRSGHVSGAMNMAVDEAILRAVARGGTPTLRFYGWDPPAVSIGYFQDAEKEVDTAACKSLGVDVVRRPTGGRAVLHDVEVTYSLIVPEENDVIPKGITESYRAISEGIVRGLVSLGLDAKMVSLRRKRAGGAPGAGDEGTDAVDEAGSGAGEVIGRGGREHGARAADSGPGGSQYEIVVEAPAGRPSTAACFDAPSWYEVTVGGKKVVGSAQMRNSGVLLQHGSIPLELQAEKLFTCLKFPSQADREAAMRSFLSKATSIRAALGRAISYMEVSSALIKGWQETLGVEIFEGELTERERKEAEHLAAAKYNRLDWRRDAATKEGIQTA